jgi:hypothetical protein
MSSIFGKRFVRVAVQPAFTRLRRSDYWMFGRPRMFGRVPIRRAVATQGDPALLAGPQMNPVSADLYTFGTFQRVRLFNRMN